MYVHAHIIIFQLQGFNNINHGSSLIAQLQYYAITLSSSYMQPVTVSKYESIKSKICIASLTSTDLYWNNIHLKSVELMG